MSKSSTGSDKNPDRAAAAIDRRGFLTTGAAVGAAALTAAPAAKAADAVNWDREVDVLVIGAGAGGVHAATAAAARRGSMLIHRQNLHTRGRAPGGRGMMS